MARPGTRADNSCQMSSEDDLGCLIQWGLEQATAGVEPPADVWPRIAERVRGIPAPATLRRSTFPVAPFVQAVVVSALLLAFGLGVERGVVLPRREPVVRATPTVRKVRAVQDLTDDVLRGYMLVHHDEEPPARQGGDIR